MGDNGMNSMFSLIVSGLTSTSTGPKTGAQRQREYKERYIAEYGRDAWNTKHRENRHRREGKLLE